MTSLPRSLKGTKLFTISLMSLALAFGSLAGSARPALAKGPESLANLSEQLIDAVVNISTTQRVSNDGRGGIEIPQLPEDSPFKEFFDEFFKNRQGNNGNQGCDEATHLSHPS